MSTRNLRKIQILFVIIPILILAIFIFARFSYGQKENIIVEGDTLFAQDIKIYGSDEITGYSPKSLDWDLLKSNMTNNIDNLISEYGLPYGSTSWQGLANINPSNKPEGQIWYYDGNLSLNGSVGGKGTIVLRSGNLSIDGDLSYQNAQSSIGFIVVNGTITIESGVNNVIGAYYASDGITFK